MAAARRSSGERLARGGAGCERRGDRRRAGALRATARALDVPQRRSAVTGSGCRSRRGLPRDGRSGLERVRGRTKRRHALARRCERGRACDLVRSSRRCDRPDTAEHLPVRPRRLHAGGRITALRCRLGRPGPAAGRQEPLVLRRQEQRSDRPRDHARRQTHHRHRVHRLRCGRRHAPAEPVARLRRRLRA